MDAAVCTGAPHVQGFCLRGSLSIFAPSTFSRKKNTCTPRDRGTHAGRILRAFSSVMYFFESEWYRPWNWVVVASDASVKGCGINSEEDVGAVGPVQERERFR